MNQTIAFIYAHPDDETFLSACLIRQLADQGDKPVLLLATKGDAGKKNGSFEHLGKAELAAIRESEMKKAAAILGISTFEFLDYPDGKLDLVEQSEFIDQVVAFINKHKPKIIITFPADGGNGHRDHMAISDITTQAVLSNRCPSVQKLYYIASATLLEMGHGPTYLVDTERLWAVKAEALRAHDSQLLAIKRYFGELLAFPEQRRFEAFLLGWERGVFWPNIHEHSLLDGLI